jgi:uncharacterized protein
MNPVYATTHTLTRVNSFIRSVYNWMTIGLALTGFTSFFVSQSPGLVAVFYGNPVMPIVMFIAMIFLCGFLSARIHKMEASTATGLYAGLAVAYGLVLTPIFLIYTASSIVSTFFICAATFGAASVYGMVTKKDLTGMAQFMMMGLIGIIIAMIVNIFIGSTMMQTLISCIAVIIFTGLTAYDTQKLKTMAVTLPEDASGAMVRKGALMGALSLYLDFMGLFIHLLHLLGIARD